MPIDGIVIRSIVKELRETLTNGRIDKVAQPETDEIILTIRSNGKNYKLLLSSSPVYPRVQLTDEQKQNPISAPMFCMVLRKHISGGKIVKIEQHNIDRIIKLFIESYDELGNLSIKTLICEIMGRYSNIILINESSREIIDSVKRITPDMSSYRQILPGAAYIYPPEQDKLNPLCMKAMEITDRISNSAISAKLGKFISQNIDGINIFAAREICNNAGLDENALISSLDSSAKASLETALNSFISSISSENFSPCIYYEGQSPYDFYCMEFNYLKHLEIEKRNSVSEIIELYYYSKDKSDRARQKSSDILKIISTNLERCYKKLDLQGQRLLECKDKEKWRLYGDLIMANMYNIKKGDSRVVLQNFYEDNQPNIEIPLDMLLTPPLNAQKYYKIYNKEKSAESAVEQQKKENLEEIEYLESQLVSINNCTEENEIEEIRNELAVLGYIKHRKKAVHQKQKQSKPMHYLSSDGYDIFVGKNNTQNDYLTLKLADPSDIWMHTKNIPGSHVIIKANNKQVSQNALYEGANLAAFYSKAKDSANVPVDYTEKRNVKKPSGAKPGMVIYYTNKTIYVTPDENTINHIQKNS